MKGLYWSALPPYKVTCTIWSDLGDFKVWYFAMLMRKILPKALKKMII